MKGIVFTEFLELVETKFGLEVVDQIIESSNLASGGAYTSVGTYSFSEMLSLLTNLSDISNLSINDLLKVYGHHFFGVIERSYAGILETYKGPLEMISSIESHIHVEVRKIYPDAELPKFSVIEKTDNKLILEYFSSRSMYAFAIGLMEKTFQHYNRSAVITYELLKEDGSHVKFVILKDGQPKN
ncbi:MAG: heme NO-binding domain-containing protein [Flavobacteriaceae bacterium]